MQLLKVTRPMMRGADVEVFQVLVTQAGHDCGAVDRIYGPKCEAACRAYQRAQGLAVDGICGPKTWQKLLCGQQNEPQTPHFTLREWRCKDGSDVPDVYKRQAHPSQANADAFALRGLGPMAPAGS